MKKTFTLWAACALPMLSPLSAQEAAEEHAKTRKDRERLIDLVIDLEADFGRTLQDYKKLQKEYAALLKKPVIPDQSAKVKELQTKLNEALAKLKTEVPSEAAKRNQALLKQDLINLRNELHRERQDVLVARARLIRVKELEAQNKALEKDLGNSTAERTKMAAELKTLMAQLKDKMVKLAKSEENHEKAIARIQLLEKETVVLKKTVETQDAELAKLRTEKEQSIKKAMTATADFKKEQEQLKALLAEREKQLANLQSHLNAEVKRTLEIPLLIEARDELQKKFNQSTTKSAELEKQNESLTAKKTQLENEIKAVEKSIASMRTQLEKNQVTMASVAKLTEENKTLKTERGELEETIEMAKGELVKAMGVRNRLEAELETRKEVATEAVALTAKLKDANQGLLAEQALLRQHLLETKETVEENTREQEKLKTTVASLEKEKTNLTGEISTRNTELAKLRTALTKKPDMEANIAKLQKEKDELAAKLAKREEDLNNTRKELGKLQINATVIENKLAAVKRSQAIITPVRYAKGEADVTEQQTRVLTQVREVLKLFPDARFEIVGHTCDLGTATGNLKLSQQRARALQDFLISKGIKKERLKSRGVGQTEPAVPNTNEANRRQNRRVVVEILD